MAAIIFVDVVGYSRLPNLEQQELSQEINERCARFLIPEFRHQRLVREATQALMVAAMPTGDGIVICLERTPRPGLDTGHVLLLLAFYLSEWSKQRDISLRIGLHSGDLAVIEDINGNSNFCGHAINQTQRIMDLGGVDGHILCSTDFNQSYLSSKRVLKELAKQVGTYIASRGIISSLPKDNPVFQPYRQLSSTTNYYMESTLVEGDYTVKHGYQLKICNIYLSAEITIPAIGDSPLHRELVHLAGWKVPPPYRVTHEILDPKRMEDNNGFMLENVLFKDCERIVVIGSINERFANHLAAAYEKDQFGGLVRVDVYFCSKDSLDTMRPLQDIDLPHTKIQDIPSPIANRDMAVLRSKSMDKLQQLQQSIQAKFNFYEYPFLPCAGVIAGYKKIDSQEPVIIQVNRYVWGQKSLWSSVQVLRKAQHGSDIDEYSKFKRYIDFTQHNSASIGEDH